jgi:hypothetical protein
MTKKLVTRYQYIDLDDNIDELIIKLQKAKAEGWEANELYVDPENWSDTRHNYLTKQELETDKEYAQRLDKEEIQRQSEAERDAREYKRLKAKFEIASLL